MRRLPLVLTPLLFAMPASGGLKAACPGAGFAHSCVRRLYRGFDGAGVCTRDFSQLFVDGSITDCWANGARARIDGFGSGAGTSVLRTRTGKVCRRGVTTTSPDFSVTIAYRLGKRTWRIDRTAAGDFTVTCPNGTVEHHSAADVAAGPCGPIADCAAGTCP